MQNSSQFNYRSYVTYSKAVLGRIMSGNSNVRRLVQVSEEAAPVLHVPIFVGNECYIITQQDVRRIEDTRFLTYNKICTNGTLEPIVPGGGALYYTGENYGGAERTQFQANCANIEEFIKYLHAKHAPINCVPPSVDVEMKDLSQAMPATVPTIEQQLKWSKSCAPQRQLVTHGVATSTGDLRRCANACTQCTPKRCANRTCATFTHVCSCGVNTNGECDKKDEVQKKELISNATQTDSTDFVNQNPMKCKKKTTFLCDINKDIGSNEHVDHEFEES